MASASSSASVPSSTPDTCTLHIYIKSEDRTEATTVQVKRSDLPKLKQTLAGHPLLAERLHKLYKDGQSWMLLTPKSDPIKNPAADLKQGDTVLLGLQHEPLKANLNIKVRHITHYNVMTETKTFQAAGGKEPARILFCEFIDNSIEAMRRMWDATPHAPHSATIEIHLVYSQVGLTGGYDAATKQHWPLKHIVILDHGPGMTHEQLRQWAEMANPTDSRREAIANKGGEWTSDPCHADGQLGKFGVGSKQAGFFYGMSVRAVTRHREDLGKAGPNSNWVSELMLSKSEFERRQSSSHETGEDWMHNKMKMRPGYDKANADSRQKFEAMRSAEEKQSSYLIDLMQRVEEKKQSFTLFIISEMREKTIIDLALGKGQDASQDLVRELRDMYFVYTDGLHAAVKEKMRQSLDVDVNDWPDYDFRFRYGRVDVQIHVAKQSNQEATVAMKKSLRFSDVPEKDELRLAPLTASTESHGVANVDRLNRLFELAAPDLFRFRLVHGALGNIEGMVLYLPCEGGIEKIEHVQLHEDSRAIIFWKGRLIPYAKLSQLLPFMTWSAEGGRKLTAEEIQMQKRTVLILFMDGIAQVDQTKFHISDDLDLLLQKYPPPMKGKQQIAGLVTDPHKEFHFAYWYQNPDNESGQSVRQGWQPAYRDLTNPIMPENLKTREGRNSESLHVKFKEWTETCHARYDKVVEISVRVADKSFVVHPGESGRASTPTAQTELTFEQEDRWKQKIEEANRDGMFKVTGTFPDEITSEQLVFFDEMKLDARTKLTSRQTDNIILKIDLAKTSSKKGEAQTKPVCTNGPRSKTMLGRVVAFFVERDDEHRSGFTYSGNARDKGKPIMFKGPSCHCLIVRQPEELFGGLYIVSSASIETIQESKLKEEMEKCLDAAPSRLEAFFQTTGVERQAEGMSRDQPLRIRADMPFPQVVVKPLAKRGKAATGAAASGNTETGSIVFNWTPDKDWNPKAQYESLEITQTMEREMAADASAETQRTWAETKKQYVATNNKGDPSKGFLFNENATVDLPEPGLYKLTYTQAPLKKNNSKASPGKPGGRLIVDLWLEVSASRPRTFEVEKLNEDPLPLNQTRSCFRLKCIGHNGQAVRLNESVLKQQIQLLRSAIHAQGSLFSLEDSDRQPRFKNLPELMSVKSDQFGVNGIIDVEDTTVAGNILGCTFKIRIDGRCKHGCYPEDTPPGYKDGCLPCEHIGSLWHNKARQDPKVVKLELCVLGCRIVELQPDPTRNAPARSRLAPGTYIQYTAAALGEPDGVDVVMFKPAAEPKVGWKEHPGPLPDGDVVEFFESSRQLKLLDLKIVSGGPPRMVLCGPLHDQSWLTEHPDPSKPVENHSVLPKLTVRMLDVHGAFVPGAPGDHVKLLWKDGPAPRAKLDPKGNADFDHLSLAIPSDTLKEYLQRVDGGEQRVRHYIDIEVVPYNDGSMGSSSISGARDPQALPPAQGFEGALTSLGLQWTDLGTSKPATGTAIKKNTKLAKALEKKTLFTEEEKASFDIKDLRPDSYVLSGTHYFRPATTGLQPLTRYMTVEPSRRPQKLMLMHGDVEVPMGMGSSAAAAQVPDMVTITAETGTELSGLRLLAFDEVGRPRGPPYDPSTTELYIDGEKITYNVQDAFVTRGVLPESTPSGRAPFRVPSTLKDEGRVTIAMHVLDSAGTRSRTQTQSLHHKVELCVRIVPRAGVPRRWMLVQRSAGATSPEASVVELSVDVTLDKVLRVMAVDEHGNPCPPPNSADGARIVPTLAISALGQHDDDEAMTDDEDARSVPHFVEGPAAVHARDAIPRRRMELKPEAVDTTGASGGRRSAGAQRRNYQQAVTEAGFQPQIMRVHGLAGDYSLSVSDPEGTLSPAVVKLKLGLGQPSSLVLRPSSIDVLRAPTTTGARRCVDDGQVCFQVLDCAGNPLVVEDLQLAAPDVSRIEPSDETVPLLSLALDSALRAEDGGRLYVCHAVRLRFGRVPTLLKQKQQVLFKATAKHHGKSFKVAAEPVIVETSNALSRVVESLELAGMDVERLRQGTLVLDAGSSVPQFEIAYRLQSSEVVTHDELFGVAVTAQEAEAEPATAATASDAAMGTSPRLADLGYALRRSTHPSFDSDASDSPMAPNTAPTAPLAPAAAASTADDPSMSITLVHPMLNKKRDKKPLGHLGHGRYGGGEDFLLTAAGEYEVQARYTEKRAAFRSALAEVPAMGWPDETHVPHIGQLTLFRFRVQPGPPTAVTWRHKAAHLCNNTSKLVAMPASTLEIFDENYNPTSAPSGVAVKLVVRMVVTDDPRPNAPLGQGPCTALPSTAVPLDLPPAALFDSNGVATLEPVIVRAREGGMDCMLEFDLELLGWPAELEIPEMPKAAMRVRFENTERLAEAERLERERQAHVDQQRGELQRAHSKDAAKLATYRRMKDAAESESRARLQEAAGFLQRVYKQVTPLQNAHMLVPYVQDLEQKVQQGAQLRLAARLGLSRPEEQELARERPDCLGTVAEIFELCLDETWSPEAKSLTALLADYMGVEALRMVVTRTRDSASRIHANRALPRLRVFALDQNPHRGFTIQANNLCQPVLQQLHTKAQYAGNILRVRPAKINEWATAEGSSMQAAYQLADEIKNKVIGATPLAHVLIMFTEKDALDYQKLLAQKGIPNPEIVCLRDGFKLASKGYFGGNKGRLQTSLDRLPQSFPYLGCSSSMDMDETTMRTLLDQLRDRHGQIMEAERRRDDEEQKIRALGVAMQARQQQVAAHGLGGPLDEIPTAPGYSLRDRSRSAEEAGMHAQSSKRARH
eukprot:jgi/Chrpa1/29/Chrysochromulina_OHIO_Genome00000072-RA